MTTDALGSNIMVGDVYLASMAAFAYGGSATATGGDATGGGAFGGGIVYEATTNPDSIPGGTAGSAYGGDASAYGGNVHNVNQVDLGVHNEASVTNAEQSGANANNNIFTAFNDTITGGGDETVAVGDVWVQSMDNEAQAGYVSAKGGVAHGSGADYNGSSYTSGGHAWNRNEITLSLNNVALGTDANANNNTFTAFNDDISVLGGYGGNTLVGDVMAGNTSGPFQPVNCPNGMFISATGFGHAHNTNEIFLGAANTAQGGHHAAHADGNTFVAFNDSLVTDSGDNTLVGDVQATMQIQATPSCEGCENNLNHVSLDLINVAGGTSNCNYNTPGWAYGDGNNFTAFNDVMSVAVTGSGANNLVGDVRADMHITTEGQHVQNTNAIDLSLTNVAFHASRTAEANHNTFNAFNDSMTVLSGGYGGNNLIGDVSDNMSIDTDGKDDPKNLNEDRLEAFNGAIRGDSHDAGAAQIADHNLFHAFNDTMSATASLGDNNMVGDVWMSAEISSGQSQACNHNHVALGLTNSAISASPTAEANNNTFTAFNDQIASGGGNDFMVGDVAAGSTDTAWTINVHGSGDNNTNQVDLTIHNRAQGASGDFNDAAIADSNTFSGYNDNMSGGAGNDFMVGDVFANMQIHGSGLKLVDCIQGNYDVNEITLAVTNVASKSAEASNNTFVAFNDTMDGGTGDNTMAGDVYANMSVDDQAEWDYDNKVNLDLKNSQVDESDHADGNTFTAFNDIMSAAGGNDFMVGDVALFGHYNTDVVNFSVINDGGANTGVTFNAFNDNMSGGAGNDSIYGDVFMTGACNSQVNVDIAGIGTASNLFDDTIDGGAGNDVIVGDFQIGDSCVNVTVEGDHGALFSDSLIGGDGNDSIFGDGTDNTIIHGLGDTGSAGEWQDTLLGGTGDDLLNGGLGNNTLDGGSGSDTASWENNPDGVNADLVTGIATHGGWTDTMTSIENLTGSNNDDTLAGDGGANNIVGGDGGDQIDGRGGDDNLSGEDGNDTINGGDGNDTLLGGGGDDSMDGGTGNDLLNGGTENDQLTGGGGNDTFAFDLHQNTTPGDNDGNDEIHDWSKSNDVLSFHNVLDGAGNDHQDLVDSINNITDDGTNTTIHFNNGANLQIDGIVATGADTTAKLDSLVNDAATQIQIAHT